MNYGYKPANKSSRKKRKRNCLIALFVFLGIACLAIFFAGIALIAEARRKGDDSEAKAQGADCGYSEEAKRVKLDKLLQRAQDKYYELNPNKISSKPGVTPAEVKKKYRSYDPAPESIKLIADESAKIVKDIEKIPLDMDKLTLREKRAVSQLLHWAKHSFPFMLPYSYDYYVGDWMLGADIFCWNPICMVPNEVQPAFIHFKPSTVSEMETLKSKFKELNHTFVQFVENMKLGVAAGMVRTIEDCKAGLDGLKTEYRDVAVNGPTGKKLFKCQAKQKRFFCCCFKTLKALSLATKLNVWIYNCAELIQCATNANGNEDCLDFFVLVTQTKAKRVTNANLIKLFLVLNKLCLPQ